MTRERVPLSPIEKIACELAIVVPLRQSANTAETRVPWEVVHRLRAALDEAGVDWRATRADAVASVEVSR